jgi:hypothetical protein
MTQRVPVMTERVPATTSERNCHPDRQVAA